MKPITLDNTMARPRKQRMVDGVVLADNLYPDARKRPCFYRYRRPDGSDKTFQTDTPEEANSIAESNNARRTDPLAFAATSRETLSFHMPRFIKYRERQDQKLLKKQSWRNRKYALVAFGKRFDLPLGMLDRNQIKIWWEELTFHEQKQRHAEFRRLFNWLMSEGLCQLPYNPFTTNDDNPRLYVTGEPERARIRLTRETFWAIYNISEYPALQIAMGLSLTTFMREADLCSLVLNENVESGLLKKVIGKSLEARGSANAARLQWDVGSHGLVKQLLARARELSLKNYRCPYLLSHQPKIRRIGKTKDHFCQVTRRRLVTMFAEARDATGMFDNLEEGRTPPTFHEVRSLGNKLATDAGYKLPEIQHAMAHENPNTTKLYQEEHSLPFTSVDVVFTEDMIGGQFA